MWRRPLLLNNRRKKGSKAGLVVLALSLLISVGCGKAIPTYSPTQSTLDELLSNPDQYNDKYIVLEGFYFHGWEVNVLSERLEYSGYAERHLVPRGQMAWIGGSIPKEVYDRLSQQEMMGPTERYGKVRIKGTFQYGAGYGHTGGFSAQIVPSEVELLPWSPPPKQK